MPHSNLSAQLLMDILKNNKLLIKLLDTSDFTPRCLATLSLMCPAFITSSAKSLTKIENIDAENMIPDEHLRSGQCIGAVQSKTAHHYKIFPHAASHVNNLAILFQL